MENNTLNLYPNDLTEAEYNELAVLSAIHPALIEANFIHIEGALVYTYLFISDQIKRRNTGRVTDGFLKRYQYAENGGIWISGLDPDLDWRPMEWGRFKPTIPRIDWEKGKPIKYESPPKAPNRVTYFAVPDCIWELVARRYKINYLDEIALSIKDGLPPLTFWEWVQRHPEIPIILCEGEKKAACLMSLGFVAIPLPGIWGGRVGKKDFNEHLHPDLLHIAHQRRKFIILFDYETKLKTRWAVHQAIMRTGETIKAVGCGCEVASLPGSEKGIDDFVVARGAKANELLTAIIDDAKELKDYQRSYFLGANRGLSNKYPADIRVTVKYLSEAVCLPEAGMVVIASDMGTGKTQLLVKWRQQNPNARFLNNGHRVNLLKNLSERLKTKMYTELNHGEFAEAEALSITIDSLYKLYTSALKYDCVFIDEACQYLTHLLHSKTCKEYRAQILEVLEYIVYNARLVVIADAHMDDITVNFFRAMRPKSEKPLIIVNQWRNGGRQVFWYEGNNSSAIVAEISASLLRGEKIMVGCDSKRAVKKLEHLLLAAGIKVQADSSSSNEPSKTASPFRIWSIHSENSGSEENVAFIKDITNAVKNTDALLTSPSLGTGVDIPEYHFDAVFGIFHGVSQTATECAQTIHRYRPKVPLHVWVAPRPPFGYKDTNPNKIKENLLQANSLTAFLLKIDRETGKRGAEKDWALDAYCQIEAKRNQSINNLREDLRSLLTEMGNTINLMGAEEDARTKQRLLDAAKALDAAYCADVAGARDIGSNEYKKRQGKDYLKPEEVFECEKFRIKEAYGITVTPELVAKDQGGRLNRDIGTLEGIMAPSEETITDPNTGKTYPLPPSLVTDKDRFERKQLSFSMDWTNNSPDWVARNTIGLPKILKRLMDGEEITATDPDLVQMTQLAIHLAPHIKVILGFTVPPDCKPIWLLAILLDQLALKLVSRKIGSKGKQVRHYSLSSEELDFALKVIKHRQNKRASLEERARIEQEQQRRYQAGMFAMYGVAPDNESISTHPYNDIKSSMGEVDTKQVNYTQNE